MHNFPGISLWAECAVERWREVMSGNVFVVSPQSRILFKPVFHDQMGEYRGNVLRAIKFNQIQFYSFGKKSIVDAFHFHKTFWNLPRMLSDLL